MFQSLFLWIFRSYSGKKLHSRRAWRVSILVLMDLSFLRDMRVVEVCSLNSGFNPCSYGSFVLTRGRMITLKIDDIRFNPCSYGSFVLTKLP